MRIASGVLDAARQLRGRERPELPFGQRGLAETYKQAVESVERQSIGGGDLDSNGPAVRGVIDHQESVG